MQQVTQTKKGTFKSQKKRDILFVTLVVAWPIIHFLIFWVGMNSTMFVNSFREVLGGEFQNKFTFENYTNLIRVFKEGNIDNIINFQAILHSLSIIPLVVCINIPITLLFSYAIFRKYKFHKFFQITLFIPTVISAVVLCKVFQLAVGGTGFITQFLDKIGAKVPVGGYLGNNNTAWITILVFSIWTGISTNLIYFSSAMGRISYGVIESAEIEGASHFRQFISIVIPMIWPTITTIAITGISAIFGWFLPTQLLTAGKYNTSTLGFIVFVNAQNPSGTMLGLVYSMGVLIAVIGAIMMFAIKKLLESFWKDVEY